MQAASLRFSGVDCELVLVLNLDDPGAVLDERGAELLGVIDELGVRRVVAPYDHAPGSDVTMFYSSRYVFDAILATAPADEPDRRLWLVDVDCVWRNPGRAFATLEADGDALACVTIGYPPDWDVSGHTRASIGRCPAARSQPRRGSAASCWPAAPARCASSSPRARASTPSWPPAASTCPPRSSC